VIFLPIVERELRAAARRRSTYLGRLGAAAGALLVGCFVFLTTGSFAPQELGMALFQSLAWLAFLFCALAGVRLTADRLSEERREGTLGLLFLTDLKGYDIVLGKLAAAALPAFFNLLAVFPILAIPLTLGGVTGTQLWQVPLSLLTTQLLSLAVGLAVSVRCHNGRKAAAMALLIMIVLLFGPLPLAAWWHHYHPGQSATPIFTILAFSPGFAHQFACQPDLAVMVGAGASMPIFFHRLFWLSIGFAWSVALLCLIMTSWVLPRVWTDRPASSALNGWRGWLHAWQFGQPRQRAAFRRRLLDRNPFYWLTSRDRFPRLAVWLLLGALAAVSVWGNWHFRDDWQDDGMNFVASIFAHGALKCWIAFAVVLRLAEDRRSGALDLVLSTELTDREIFQGQWRSLVRQFAAPLAVVLLADAYFCHAELRGDYLARTWVLQVYAGGDAMLLLDAVTIACLGLWTAITARHPNQAAVKTLAAVVGWPWLMLLGVYLVWAISESFGAPYARNSDPSERVFLALWFFMGLTVDLLLIAYASRRLQRDFRRTATEPFAARRGWLRHWLAGDETAS
jgi:hypothetical protein